MQDPIIIGAAKRTPIGHFNGAYVQTPAADLGAAAIRAALEQAGLPSDAINEVIMGCVLSAGQGQAPARQAALGAGLSQSTPCSTINKMCGSGMKAVMFAYDMLLAGTNEIMVAGGLENMSLAPYLLPKARQGYRMGHQEAKDHMFLDGLEDAYDKGKLMGVFAEMCAEKCHITRDQQDQLALRSYENAMKAHESGWFKDELTPVTVKTRREEKVIKDDETPTAVNPNKIPQLRPAFKKDGTVTAANASSISDGAAALVLMRQSTAEKHNVKPLAKIVAHAQHAQEPEWFTTAPINAMQKVLERADWPIESVDLFEINEAFAVVTNAAIQALSLDPTKVNVHGGACALGHPIGATGARIITTLLYALHTHQLERGIASLCIGGGEATAVAIEKM